MERKIRPSTSSRSVRRARRQYRSTDMRPAFGRPETAIQVFVFEGDVFVQAELFCHPIPVVIGRHPQAGLRLDADTVSRRHCRLAWTDGGLRLRDLDSGNGTLVNGQPLRGGCAVTFRDTIQVGPFTLKIRTLQAAGAPPLDPIAAEATTRIQAISAPKRSSGPIFGEGSEDLTERGSWPQDALPPALTEDFGDRLRDLNDLLESLDDSAMIDPAEGPWPSVAEVEVAMRHDPFTVDRAEDNDEARAAPPSPRPVSVVPHQDMDGPAEGQSTIEDLRSELAANDEPATDRVPGGIHCRPSRGTAVHTSRLLTPTSQKVSVEPLWTGPALDEVRTGAPPALSEGPPARPKPRKPSPLRYRSVEIAARINGRLVSLSILRNPRDEYILGYPTPQGPTAPARSHLGLRLVKINEDRTVDLVFPNDVGGHLVRGTQTVSLHSLTEGRKYSCLRLEPTDIAAIYLGRGREAVSYHLRFVLRPASVLRTLRRRSP